MRFYPLTLPLAFKLKNTGRALGRAFAAFYAARQNGSGHSVEDITDPDGFQKHTFSTEGMSPEFLRERANQAEIAIDQILEAVTSPTNWVALCDAIAHSLKDYREEHGQTTQQLSKELQEGMDIPSIVPMLKGLLKANASQFGSAGEALGQALNQGLGGLAGMMSDSTGTTTPDGGDSKTTGSDA